MDFSLTPEQEALVETARAFARDHLKPNYRLRDQEGRMDRPTLKRMGELGLFGIELPEEIGGLGQDCLTAGLVVEALCGEDLNIGYVTINASLDAQIMRSFGTPDVVDPWIRGMLSGELIASIALTEPGGGSDAANLKLRARRDGDDYIIDGEKTSISLADQADFTVAFARTGTTEARAKGISSFLIPLDLPGISRTSFDDHGGRSVGRGSLFFDNVRVPASHLLGTENAGFSQVMAGFDYSRALLGILCLSVARVSLDAAWKYTNERFTFGKPLSEYQGVTFPLAEAETQWAGARLLCLQTLWLKDRGLPHTAEAAMCKWWGPKLAYDIVNTCLLTHGHGGYSKDMPFEQRLRDLLGLQIGDGTAQIMKMVIARQKTKA
ncbi:MAG: cyclohexanecarboxyl-CoA dehydrogenase [Rhodobiaceae bacterium]|nr:cyclohexanecarboxyl-CoA dehydrogenase [Rhodobiaceae bacterium]MCC0056175.1 cyclohexanecarboxyl-CoA dehydrogenase [Rhodobiaceae bacterium]